MATLTVRFEWKDDLGPVWFNLDNLRVCLFSAEHTWPDLLDVEVVETTPVERAETPGVNRRAQGG